ncbi:MAG: isocitrate/isopropylmalate dehydrogenase family protein [Clostridiales bacterium]|jgi:isocitrate dehydrogenase (NAD+)|nr:isocitrate/isopropylmalate dehydrogenase family protein [Clostridiales bacterium]
MEKLSVAKQKFEKILLEQLGRIERMKSDNAPTDYRSLESIIIGIVGGDGIGPVITEQAKRLMEFLLKDEIAAGTVVLRVIEGLTIENRAAVAKAIPDDVLAELMKCHVILKGPTTTPEAGSPWPNIESANVAMRKELDLFANVRPVRAPEQGIDWTFFRENTEGAYAVGSKGFEVDENLAVDFTIATTQGTERIVRAAFEYAKANNKTRVTAVTKANVIKTTDGKFLRICRAIAKEYPGISFDEWYIDIMTAKLIDPKRRKGFQVLVLPNLYGDILTDEAAEFQGGVGTAGSANIGRKYAMFEAIHGSAPRMVKEGREDYADPSSIMRAAAMLMSHIGFERQSERLNRALDDCMKERAIEITGRPLGASVYEWTEYVMKKL